MDGVASSMRWFLIAGCFGVVLAVILSLLLSYDLVPAGFVIALWPTSILGLVDPSSLVDKAITGIFTYGGNFLLYGFLGLFIRYLGSRMHLFRRGRT